MQVPAIDRTLLSSLMTGAIVLLGAGACSRSDRTESGSSNIGTMSQDTTVTMQDTISGGGQTAAGTTGSPMDTTRPAGENTGTGAAQGDTAPAKAQSNAPRAATAPVSGERQSPSARADTGMAGYRPIQGDSVANQVESDSARVISDTAETSMNPSHDSAAGYSEMARDTTSGADQIDTTSAVGAVGADVEDTTMNAGRVRPVEDSTEILGQVTTDTTNAVAATDSAEAAGEAAVAAPGADTTQNAGRIRPPEDSTELQGNVNAAESASVNAADTADEAPVAEVREYDPNDRETEVASETRTEAVGAAALGGTVTGADAVAMMTRQGEQCTVVDPESDEEVRWDMSSTPATLNPCGLGSMNLSKVWTVEPEGQE